MRKKRRISIFNVGLLLGCFLIPNMNTYAKLSSDSIYDLNSKLPLSQSKEYFSNRDFILENSKTNSKPTVEEEVDFMVSQSGYLVGDSIEATITLKGNYEEEVPFNLSLMQMPKEFHLIGPSKAILSSENPSYTFQIKIDSILDSAPKSYQLVGTLTERYRTQSVYTPNFEVKKGQVKVILEEGLDADLLQQVKLYLVKADSALHGNERAEILNQTIEIPLSNRLEFYEISQIESQQILFENIPSGQYILVVDESSLPEGWMIKNENRMVELSYNHPVKHISIEKVYSPNLEVELTTGLDTTVHNNELVNIGYQINPQPVQSGEGLIPTFTETLFLVDPTNSLSKMDLNSVVVGMEKMLESIQSPMKVGVMSPKLQQIKRLTDIAPPIYSLANEAEKSSLMNELRQLSIKKSKNEWDIEQSLDAATRLISLSTETDSKAIVMVSNHSFELDSEMIERLKHQNCKLIILDLSQKKNGSLVSLSDNEWVTVFSISSEPEFKETIGQVNKMLTEPVSSFTVSPTLVFDLGNKFEAIEGLQNVGDTRYETLPLEIEYQLDSTGCEYRAQPVEVFFKVRVTNAQVDEQITFKNQSIIHYEQRDGSEAEKTILSPNFTVIKPEVKLDYGLYGGVHGDKIEIISHEMNAPKRFIEGSMVYIAALFEYQPYYQDYSFSIDSRLPVSEESIRTYRIQRDDTGQINLEPIESVKQYIASFSTYTHVRLNLYNKVEANDQLLILYHVEMPKGSHKYRSTVTIDETEKFIEIEGLDVDNDVAPKGNLPSLF